MLQLLQNVLPVFWGASNKLRESHQFQVITSVKGVVSTRSKYHQNSQVRCLFEVFLQQVCNFYPLVFSQSLTDDGSN